MTKRLLCLLFVIIVCVSFLGCNQVATDFLIDLRNAKKDHPKVGVYHNDELNICIAFGVDEYCPILMLSDGSSYRLGVQNKGRFVCIDVQYDFWADFTWNPGDDYISIRIVKYVGDYTPGKWYVLTPTE